MMTNHIVMQNKWIHKYEKWFEEPFTAENKMFTAVPNKIIRKDGKT